SDIVIPQLCKLSVAVADRVRIVA
ncbi:MAG: hypothetical protein JWM36_2155, partial [Hyphomicrobiales bacterium]|nr:hypothetical protein [Hyphomicrobiales bacterium]